MHLDTERSNLERTLARILSAAQRVLVVGDPPAGALCADLAPASCRVERGTPSAMKGITRFARDDCASSGSTSAPDVRGFDLVVCAVGSAAPADVRDALAEGGHVCYDFSAIRATELRSAVRALVVALSESGFAIQVPREIHDPALEWAGGSAPPLLLARVDRFRIRHYRPGDESEILDLFERSFFVRRPAEHWDWEYRQNPYGALRMSLVIDDGGKIVVHYAGYPVPMWSAGAPYPTVAIQIVDTMTEVGVRHVGRGHTTLLCRAIRHFYATFCDEKVAYAYGFNVANIQKICTLYIGGTRVESVGYWKRSMEPPPAPAPSLFLHILGNRSSASIESPGDEFDELFDRVAPSYDTLIERKSKYLGWRYTTSPFAQYAIVAVRRGGRLVGWSVFRRKENDLVWVDALFDPRFAADAAAVALRYALALPIAAGASAVTAWFPERPVWWPPILRGLGFERGQEPNDLALVLAPFTDADAPAHLASSLYYTAGDSDLY